MKHWLFFPAVIAVVGFAFGTPNFAPAQDYKSVVKERSEIMKTVSKTLKELRKKVKEGKVDKKDTARVAKALAAAKKFANLFPAGSHSGAVMSRAKKALWDDFSKFKAQNDKLVAALVGLQKAADFGDAGVMGKAVKKVRGTCRSCHKQWRGPKLNKK